MGHRELLVFWLRIVLYGVLVREVVRKFLIDLTFSIVISFGLWEFGLARRIWPAHPYLAIGLLTAITCAVLQIVLKRDAEDKKRSRRDDA